MNFVTSEYLRHQQLQARRQGVWLGTGVGAIIALSVAAGVGYGLDEWRVRNHERLIAQAEAKISAELAECKTIVRDLAEEEYATVLDYKHQIDKIQGRAQ